MQILKLDGLCKQYPAFRLENVSFSMEAGTIMGLIGRNGAGKTTTLKSMLHLVHPDAGTVTICGLDMDKDEREIRSRIGFVSGGASYYQRKRLRELTDVTKRFYPGWDDGRYARLVRQFSLDESKRVCELSEGMKVKYQLAAAMSHRAELLILDEPTSGLDPVSRDELLDTFRTLCEQEGVSILFSTHITSDLDACADTITYIQHGRVAASTDKKAWTGGISCCRAATRRVHPRCGPRASARAATKESSKRFSAKRTPRWPPASHSRRRIWNRSWSIWNGRRKHEAADEKGMEAGRHAGAAAVFAAERAGARAELSVLRDVFL